MKLRCLKCNETMREAKIPAYEHEKGVVLRDVSAVECPKCGEWAFTEQQIDEVERRNDVAKVHRFAFNRTITVSGRSLVLNLPEDLVRHMNLAKGRVAKIIPLDDHRLMIEV